MLSWPRRGSVPVAGLRPGRPIRTRRGVMKKFLLMCLLALPWVALSQEKASAWCNMKFGCGLNFEFSSGGNNLLWGAYTSSQPPGFYGVPNGGYGMPNDGYGM